MYDALLSPGCTLPVRTTTGFNFTALALLTPLEIVRRSTTLPASVRHSTERCTRA
eukprot:CAMPEP_0180254346 /NCGR_PEP_ID=MMETSP0987-20121128/40120_1 /TAXON_ID=697907 /ORGANISM="non described non described, Strain CCMP2293" /LENGTH=54 /DNA_ID=CAMNT_0022223345 /DNA_START=28 /DNA_END=189 /DNA_ORIENTATION=-